MRTEGDLIKINRWLLPLSWLYGLAVSLRNELFALGILKERSFSIPVISVGNITVGGSGKTPHVEYLIRLLQDYIKVGVLSRGYKRKSHGYVLADDNSTMRDLGDEPYQIKQKFHDIYVAVDKNRCNGITRLTHDKATSNVGVILLDDAFQHRYVKPGLNILLVDYHRLIIYDRLLPAGRLREPLNGKQRADIVIITKCPRDLKPMEFRILTKAMDLFPYQQLFFTTIDYGTPQALFSDKTTSLNKYNVLLVTGIASPEQMENDMKHKCRSLTSLAFEDHHLFNTKDEQRINNAFERLPSPKIIVTTEKDSTRLVNLNGLTTEVRDAIFVLPIKVKFMLNQGELFNNKIISYVRKNSRNSNMVKRKNDNASRNSHHSGNRTGTISFRNN
ncbi:MAG: tetraacyldisaccharide 4'-kinase [Prevotellaceae bacterium]|nr:tetraacyldisaccharide 4'-kinase [Prevotellaceae bacterium]